MENSIENSRNGLECSEKFLKEDLVDQNRKCFRMSEKMGISLSKCSSESTTQTKQIEESRQRKKGTLSTFIMKHFVPVVNVPDDTASPMDVDDVDLSIRSIQRKKQKQTSMSYSSFENELFFDSPSLDVECSSISTSPTSILHLSLTTPTISIVKKMMMKMRCEYQYCTEFAELIYNKIHLEKFQYFTHANYLFAAATIWIVLKYEIDHISDTATSLSYLVLTFDSSQEKNTCARNILFAEGEILNQLNWNLMAIIEPYKTWLQRRLVNAL